jgi:hypothetical protein
MLLAGALAASLGGGIGAAALAEALDRSVKGARALAALLDAPLLAVIPRVVDAAALARRRRWLLAGLGAGALLALAAAAGLHFLVMPLDSAWYALLRRLHI